MPDPLAAARSLLPGQLEVVATLHSGERSTVHLVHVDPPAFGAAEMVVKQFTAAGESWVRETAALACLDGAAGVAPRLLAETAAPPIAVVEFAGTGGNVADALLGGDATAAAAAVRRWAAAVAALHVVSKDRRAAFRSALEARQGDFPVADAEMPVAVEDAVRRLGEECAALGVAVPSGSFDAMRELARRLAASEAAALSPSDTCPDNNVLHDDRLVLLDFEGAQWRHIAWDVAYLRVPWPTCWCSWRLPPDVTENALDAYRDVARPQFRYVDDDSFDRDVVAAAVCWSLMSAMWFLDRIRAGDPPLSPDRPAPSRREIVQHRLHTAARDADRCGTPELGELAQRLATVLADRYGGGPLDVAPAFRQAPGQ